MVDGQRWVRHYVWSSAIEEVRQAIHYYRGRETRVVIRPAVDQDGDACFEVLVDVGPRVLPYANTYEILRKGKKVWDYEPR